MRSTPFMFCSMGVATACSMVVASAPVYVVVRLICGGRICGNCAMGSPTSETTPMSTVMMAMTIATMGRRTKNADIERPLSVLRRRRVGRLRRRRGRRRRGGRRLRVDHRAVADLLHAFHDHAIALVQALGDDAHAAAARSELDPLQ